MNLRDIIHRILNLSPRDIALLKILIFMFMSFYSIFNGILIAWIFVSTHEYGMIIVSSFLVMNGIITVCYFKFVYPHELGIGSRLNPEWNKLMEMQNNGEKRE